MSLEWIWYTIWGIAGLFGMFLVVRLSPLQDCLTPGVKIVTVVCFLVALGVAADSAWRPDHSVEAQLPPPTAAENGFVTSKSCKSCHPSHYDGWYHSFHRTMTQPVHKDTVVAPFDERVLSDYGESARLIKRGDEYWVNMVDPDWQRQVMIDGKSPHEIANAPRVDKQVVMTTGSHNFQVYWIKSTEGRDLIQFPWRFYIPDKRWMHRYDVFLSLPGGSESIATYDRVWNRDCSGCHSVGTEVGFNHGSGYFTETRVGELGIACEACHGPASRHVQINRDPIRRYGQHLRERDHDSKIVNPARISPERSVEICGQCHSHSRTATAEEYQRFDSLGTSYRAGDDLSKTMMLQEPHQGSPEAWHKMFWDDGAERAAGREYNGVVKSGCFTKGKMTCLSCHSMHDSHPDDQLAERMDANHACTQCHPKYQSAEELTAHTHHTAGSTGSLCYNCHMPHTSYGLLKAVRSHRIDSPRVVAVTSHQRPNACNLCHLDKSLGWTSDNLNRWYGIPPAKLTDEEQNISAGALWMLRGDAGQRAITAWHAQWEPGLQVAGTEWLAPVIAPMLEDPYAANRVLAWKALRSLPELSGMTYEYDQPVTSRIAARKEVLSRWSTSGKKPDVTRRVHLKRLFTERGQVRSTAIEDLVKRMDTIQVDVAE